MDIVYIDIPESPPVSNQIICIEKKKPAQKNDTPLV